MMLKDRGTIPPDTLRSQDGINLGDIHFCPMMRTLHMQHISLKGLCTLLSEGTFVPLHFNTPSELSGMTEFYLCSRQTASTRELSMFTWDLWSTKLIPTYTVPARSTTSSRTQRSIPGRHVMFSRPGVMLARGVPIASLWTISVALCPSQWTLPIVWCTPPLTSKASSPIILTLKTVLCGCAYTVVYAKPPCSLVTHPKQHTKYAGSHLIIPHGVQYNNHLYPSILELWNHCGPLIDPTMGEPCPMEVVGDFKATDPIFKGCYRDSLLYLDDDLA